MKITTFALAATAVAALLMPAAPASASTATTSPVVYAKGTGWHDSSRRPADFFFGLANGPYVKSLTGLARAGQIPLALRTSARPARAVPFPGCSPRGAGRALAALRVVNDCRCCSFGLGETGDRQHRQRPCETKEGGKRTVYEVEVEVEVEEVGPVAAQCLRQGHQVAAVERACSQSAR